MSGVVKIFMSVYIKLLGPPTIYYEDNKLELPTTKQHALLYYLVIQGEWVNREVLADLLWELDEAKSRSNLRVTLVKLKQDSSSKWIDYLEIEAKRLKMILANDVSEFREAINAKEWVKAQELYAGPLLYGVNIQKAPRFEEWLELERETLYGQWRKALIAQANLWEKEGRFDDASALMQMLLHEDEDSDAYNEVEDTLLQLLRCADKSGEYEQALRCYKNTKKRLEKENLPLSETTLKLAESLEQKHQQQILIAENIAPKYTIPVQANAFIGRKMELEEIASRLNQADCRLLTLKGLGGIGKTRLALQFAEGQKDNFADGVHFIFLAALQSTSNLAATILNTLKIPLRAGQTPEMSLKENLKDKEILLALDNFEHLLEGAPLLGELLEHAPDLKLLVTSREPLNITWEHTFEVFGMRYPEKASEENFAQYDAVRLFTRTAQQVDHFQLKPEHYPAVLEICRVVEGMPLGLELAASWVQAFSCQQIAEFLTKDIGIVESTLKDIPERHRNLDNVFKHSWRLLSELEQDVLSKLAIFRGGFDKEAARAITKAPHVTLLKLKQKSLVRKAKEERFDMHEVIRQGAAKKLKEDDEEYQKVRTVHSKYYLDFFTDNKKVIEASDLTVIKTIETNLDNIREAWYWAVDTLDAEILLSSLRPLHLFHIDQGRFQEALELYNYAEGYFRKHNTQHLFFPRLLERKSWCLNMLGEVQQSVVYSKESIEFSKKLNDTWGIIVSLQTLGILERERGNSSRARTIWQEALNLTKEHNEASEMLNILSNLAILEEQEGNNEQAEVNYRHALNTSKQLGQAPKYLVYLNNLATFLINTGRFDEAEALSKEGLNLSETINQSARLPYFLLKLSRVASFRENYDEAWQLAQRALVLAQEQNNISYCAKICCFLGDIALATKQLSQSYDYFKQGLQLAQDVQNSPTIHDILTSIAKLYSLEGKTEKAINLLELLLQQSPLVKTTEKNIINLLEGLREQVASAQLAEANKEGKVMNLEEFVKGFSQDSS